MNKERPNIDLVDLRSMSELTPASRVDALLTFQNAEKAVQSLDPFSLYHLVREVGREDCVELCLLASDAQIQSFVDLDCWRRDEVDTQSIFPWMRVYLQADDRKLGQILSTLDPEPLVLMLGQHLLVFHLDEGQAPPELEALDQPWETLDGVWAYVFTTDDEDSKTLLRQLLRRWYHIDIGRARAMLEAINWELPSQLTDTAYTMRQTRLAEIGFVPFDEAMAIYSRQNIEKLRQRVVGDSAARANQIIGQATHETTLPDLLRRRFTGKTYLERCIAATKELPANLDRDLVNLTNKAMAAEPADPRDLEAVNQTFDKVRGMLDIGLEFLSGGSIQLGADILTTTHLQKIFEAGHNLILGVSDQARRVFGRNEVVEALTLRDDVQLSLLSPTDRELIRGLLHPRPAYTAPDAEYRRPFATMAEIGEAAARLALLAFEVTTLYGALGITHDQVVELAFAEGAHPPVELITIQTLLRTAVVLHALEDDRTLRALATNELSALVPFSADAMAEASRELLTSLDVFTEESEPVANSWGRRISSRLSEEIGGLSAEALSNGSISPEMLGDVLLLTR